MKEKKQSKTIVKRLRVSDSLNKKIDDYCSNNGVTFTDFVSELISKKLDYCNENYTIKSSSNKSKDVHFRMAVDDYNRLVNEACNKNKSIAQELRFRISSSLSLPAFDLLELKELSSARIEISRIGGLLKYATMKGLLLNDELSNKLISEIENLKKVFLDLYIESSKRVL
ncbi:hypothetical protein ABN362_22320 [Providencia alcalifaciens]|uniref:hypothetical protein n=1 Tax=Providencia alcalifaciens TaxID=126385 RepID=UPI0032DB98E8